MTFEGRESRRESPPKVAPLPPTMRHRTLTLPALALLLASAAQAQTEYYRHSVFDNSLQRDVYYYSFAQATAPSTRCSWIRYTSATSRRRRRWRPPHM
jgi:hypothetical protein